jgi:hypothetical protein
MNSTNKKSPAARGIPQPFNRPTPHVQQTRPPVAQLKTGVSAQSVKQPVAPPVYRPQPMPKVLQRKMVNVAANAQSPVALPVRSSQPSGQFLKPAVTPFHGVVQRARRKKGGGVKQEPTLAELYAHYKLIVASYGMDKAYQDWLDIGAKIKFTPPDLSGFHASRPGNAGSKAEEERVRQITAILVPWKDALKEDLKVSHGIEEKSLGKIKDKLGM